MQKAVVCGTAFGRIYMRGVHEDPTLELAGILSRGSSASRNCAERYGVPSYTDVDEIPGDIEIACVAVRAGVSGGDGAELAQRLLRRGINVLQEHPLHPDELASCLRTARERGVVYRLNAFYPHLRPIRLFLRAAEIMRAHQPPLHVDAAAGGQVVYPLLDVVGRAVGRLRPWALADPAPIPPGLAALAAHPSPYAHVHCVLGGVPMTLRVQNQMHPADPDNHALLLHRITIAFESGVLSLADTHGPVLWSPRMHCERDETGRLIMDGPDTERLDVLSTEPLGHQSTSTFRQVFAALWPEAVRTAISEFREDLTDPRRAVQSGQWALTVTDIWHRLTSLLGPPQPIRPGPPEAIPLPKLISETAVGDAP